ncbi:MAG TPA: dihydrodipicolinate synthase family protein [Verrucomicrobiae bacterium]|nr:dihydrodipicolinate synthase family protein [Verrucomicrobiae bacterium]
MKTEPLDYRHLSARGFVSPASHLTRRQMLEAAMAGVLGIGGGTPLLGSEQRTDQPANAAPADPRVRGPFPILTTPFTASGAVDFDALANQARFVDWGGCPGMIWPQSGDSVDLLTTDEKLQGMEVLAKAARGLRTALCLGVQGKDTDEMLVFAKHAEELAPAAIISRPPDSGTTEADLRQYWRALAAVAKRPVILQTTGGVAYKGLAPSLPLLIELAKEFPHFGYVKEEAGSVVARIRALLAARPPIRRVFSARGGLGWLHESRLGTEGLITERAVYADVLTRIWGLQQSGEDPTALRDAYSKFLLMTNLSDSVPGGTFRGAQLYLWKKFGVFRTMVTRSYGPRSAIPSSPILSELKLTPEDIAEIEYRFEALKPYRKEGEPSFAG